MNHFSGIKSSKRHFYRPLPPSTDSIDGNNGKDGVQQTNTRTQTHNTGFFERNFGLDSNIASTSYPKSSRWKMLLPAVATHLCIGSPWAWSLVQML